MLFLHCFMFYNFLPLLRGRHAKKAAKIAYLLDGVNLLRQLAEYLRHEGVATLKGGPRAGLNEGAQDAGGGTEVHAAAASHGHIEAPKCACHSLRRRPTSRQRVVGRSVHYFGDGHPKVYVHSSATERLHASAHAG